MKLKSNRLYLEYFFVSLIIFAPLLKSGYVMSFDMPWGPYMSKTFTSDNTWFFYHILTFFNGIIGAVIVEKIVLISIIFLSGLGMHKLIENNAHLYNGAGISSAAYIGGLLYIFNPFVYTRLMSGQWLVLIGYSILPWFILEFYKMIISNNIKNTFRSGVLLAIIGLTSSHVIAFSLMISIVLIILIKKQINKKIIINVLIILSTFLALNCIWIIAIFNRSSHIVNLLNGYGPAQLKTFATVGSIHGSVPLSSLLLEGFWADKQGRYYLPSHLGIYWYLVVIILAFLIIYGIYNIIKRRDKLGISLFIVGAIAWWLGMGIGWQASASTSTWLFAHIPFYKGYREPQKWLMLLALAYSYFVAIGSAELSSRIHKFEWRQVLIGTCALLPILYTPVLLWGAGGQLVSAKYPNDWALAEKKLNADKTSYKVLVLPWHEYMPISFARRVVMNPATVYFKQPTVISDNPEIEGVAPVESSSLYKILDNRIIPEGGRQANDAELLMPYGIKYVVLLKEADWRDYSWVGMQKGWNLIQNTGHIQLYEFKIGRR